MNSSRVELILSIQRRAQRERRKRVDEVEESVNPLQLSISYHEVTRFDQWLDSMLNQLKSKGVGTEDCASLLANLCWSMWKARNDCSFGEKQPHPSVVIANARARARAESTGRGAPRGTARSLYT